MKFSICMTNYNTEAVIERSLDLIISKINPDEFEIMIVDSKSKDHSLDILERYAKKYGNMKIISKKCLRGRGWQTAFEHSTGDTIIIATCDTIYNDLWIKLILLYEREGFDFALSAWFTRIYPRKLLDDVGGWKNLQYWEDIELLSRLAKNKKCKTYPIVCGENLKRRAYTNFFEKTYRRYRRVHDKVLIAKHIPIYLWILAYWKINRKEQGLIGTLGRFGYQVAILFAAKIVSCFKSIFFEYGNMRYLNNLEETALDLGLGGIKDMQTEKGEYDTKEKCIEAYKKGDWGYIP
ncbi:hypothetical protein C5S29_09540 [ANME-1 cluster archaeon GoMg3.2]|nr:hypothetical protein [ANME-1 cluster archaeon GoMg3.2]